MSGGARMGLLAQLRATTSRHFSDSSKSSDFDATSGSNPSGGSHPSGSDPHDSTPRTEAEKAFSAAEGPSRSEVRIWLKNYLRADSIESPQAQEALENLRKLEGVCGPYVLAGDITDYMRSIDEDRFHDMTRAKDRGYGLAAELVIKYTYKQLELIEHEDRLLGPQIFQGYCTEILDALFMRTHARRGVEALMTLTDWLLAKACEGGQYAPLYLELADQAISTTVDVAAIKADEEERKARASIRAQRSADDLDQPVEPYVPTLDLEIVQYLRDAQRKVHTLRVELERELKAYKQRRAPSGGDGSEGAAPVNAIGLLQAMLRTSANVEYHFLSGLLSERLGALRERAERGTGLKLVKSGASYFELHGDKNAEQKLKGLARECYRRAAHLYGVVKDEAAVERVKQKATPSGVRAPGA